MNRNFLEIIFVILLVLVHSIVYHILEIVLQTTNFISSLFFLFLIGLSTFISFILFYNTFSKILRRLYTKLSFKKFLVVFGLFVVYFNILMVHFFIPGIIYLVSTLVLYQFISKK